MPPDAFFNKLNRLSGLKRLHSISESEITLMENGIIGDAKESSESKNR